MFKKQKLRSKFNDTSPSSTTAAISKKSNYYSLPPIRRYKKRITETEQIYRRFAHTIRDTQFRSFSKKNSLSAQKLERL